ncbi:MAG: hypothetical protein IT337_03280 [Thermomicrobiales bacterium]|nr:hypothetical protein [Thermomicrobiales bacterium]
MRRRLAKTAADLQAERQSQEEQAIDRVLRRPDDDGRPWELMTEPRAEDRPEIPLALQALTRLTEPTVTVVCHYGDLSGAVLVGTERPVDLKTNPARHLRTIIEASVSLSHRGVFDALTKTPPPSAWKAHAMLRSLRPLQFSANNIAIVGNWSIRLDPELGICIERSAE